MCRYQLIYRDRYLVPVGPPRVGAGLEAGDEVSLLLLKVEIHGELQEH